MELLYDTLGCDFVINLPSERRSTKVKLLQLTDTQIIDAEQRRTPDRLRIDEIKAWAPDRFDENCGDHIRALVAQASPDLIFITGDIIYGSFDDNGSSFEWFCRFMDSFGIPWAPVFGNHDNESRRGVDWQCSMLERSEFCVFKRGTVTGNSNYTLGIAIDGELLRVMYMIDSNGAKGATDPSVMRQQGIYPDQLAWLISSSDKIDSAAGKCVPAFMAFHIPTTDFTEAEMAKGYRTDERVNYSIGVDVVALDGDFGCNYERHTVSYIEPDSFAEVLKATHTDAIFVGHCHAINTVISYNGITYAYGLKTGQYDYHNPYQLGGTLVTLEDDGFSILHMPALVRNYAFPGASRIFSDLFLQDGEQ